jgi:hypothetical protein
MKRFSVLVTLICLIPFVASGDIDEFFSETRTTKSQYQKCYAWFNAEKFFYDGIFFRNWGEVIDLTYRGTTMGARGVVVAELVYLCKAFLGPYRLSWTAPPLVDTPSVESSNTVSGSNSNTPSTLKQKLLELKTLVDDGLITEKDYEQAKKQILNNM